MTDSEWLTIGEFARLGGVSIKALRLYAELGLLAPAAVKAGSGYRLYARSQLATLHRILLLKNAGFALTEIRGRLANCDEASLLDVRARLVERVGELQRQLASIDDELRSAARVVVKRVPALPVWSRRQVIESYDEADVLLHDLAQELPAPAPAVAGAVWHACGQRSGRIDCEVFWLATRRVRTVAPSQLGAVTVASILHTGGETTIGATYDVARRWLRDGRYRVAGPNRELYLEASLTEIQFPIN
jgi:DNA-binding transcriptional MerR regulator